VLAIATAQGGNHVTTAAVRERFDRLRLGRPIFDALRAAGLDEDAARAGAARIRAVVGLRPVMPPEPRDEGPSVAPSVAAASTATAWLEDPVFREAAAVNHWEGDDWLVQEQWEAVVDLWALLAATDATSADEPSSAFWLAGELQAVAEEAGYRVDAIIEVGRR
jgi:hypothetical protein